ncbi:MAG: fibronectin type III domain-containing protein, partial [Oscillospiraceae bacterium]|nr:fibronectin type III domain-containing protein [Oscillospiraceae bacterium]
LKSGTDYTLSYSKNKNIGKASVKITGKGNYTGSKTVTFKVVPKKAAISSVSESKQKITLKWGKVSGSVTGYKVYYSEKKSGDYKLLKTVKGASTTTFTTKALDSGTTYYFRVRAYKTVSGADYNGANSAVKSKKTSGTATVKKGSTIKFGDYDWRVLDVDVKNGRALIITDISIEYRAYNEENTDVTWETCDLRAYLNGEFYNSFGAADKARIAKTKVKNKDNQWFGTPGGKDTEDYVFLLSIEEVVKYFGDSGQLKNGNPNTGYHIDDKYNEARVAYSLYGRVSDWWLRSPGEDSSHAAAVGVSGLALVSGFYVYYNVSVRPAMWITL